MNTLTKTEISDVNPAVSSQHSFIHLQKTNGIRLNKKALCMSLRVSYLAHS